LTDRLKTIPGLVDLNTNLGEGKPEFRIFVRKEAFAQNTPTFRRPISAIFWSTPSTAGSPPNTMKWRKVRRPRPGRRAARRNVEALLAEPYPHKQMLIPLRELVDYEIVRGPKEIRRENQQREVLVTAGLKGAKISEVIPKIEREVAALELPSDYRVVFSGEREEMSQSFRSLVFALILAVLLTYMIMARSSNRSSIRS